MSRLVDPENPDGRLVSQKMSKEESDKAFEEIEKGVKKWMMWGAILTVIGSLFSLVGLIGVGWVVVHFLCKWW